MNGFETNHRTKEENLAFELWLKISVELIEKYCGSKAPPVKNFMELSKNTK